MINYQVMSVRNNVLCAAAAAYAVSPQLSAVQHVPWQLYVPAMP